MMRISQLQRTVLQKAQDEGYVTVAEIITEHYGYKRKWKWKEINYRINENTRYPTNCKRTHSWKGWNCTKQQYNSAWITVNNSLKTLMKNGLIEFGSGYRQYIGFSKCYVITKEGKKIVN